MIPAPRFLTLPVVNVDNGLASNNVRSLGKISTATFTLGQRVDSTAYHQMARASGTTQSTMVFAGDFVTAIFRDAQGTLWFGTPNGLSRLEPVPEKPAHRADDLD